MKSSSIVVAALFSALALPVFAQTGSAAAPATTPAATPAASAPAAATAKAKHKTVKHSAKKSKSESKDEAGKNSIVKTDTSAAAQPGTATAVK